MWRLLLLMAGACLARSSDPVQQFPIPFNEILGPATRRTYLVPSYERMLPAAAYPFASMFADSEITIRTQSPIRVLVTNATRTGDGCTDTVVHALDPCAGTCTVQTSLWEGLCVELRNDGLATRVTVNQQQAVDWTRMATAVLASALALTIHHVALAPSVRALVYGTLSLKVASLALRGLGGHFDWVPLLLGLGVSVKVGSTDLHPEDMGKRIRQIAQCFCFYLVWRSCGQGVLGGFLALALAYLAYRTRPFDATGREVGCVERIPFKKSDEYFNKIVPMNTAMDLENLRRYIIQNPSAKDVLSEAARGRLTEFIAKGNVDIPTDGRDVLPVYADVADQFDD